jgi:hypothetical protein
MSSVDRISKRTVFSLGAVAFLTTLEIAVIVAAVLVALKFGFGIPIPLGG